MATIPAPYDRERATPRNRMQFQDERAPSYEGEKAEIALTGEIGKFGEQLFRATEYLASVKAEDGANQLRDAENELHIELLGKKGADANVDLQKEFREKRDASVKAISEKLGGRAGSIFSGNAARGSAPYDARVINYQMDEQKKYAETVRLTGNETRNQTAYQARDQASLAGLINEQRTSSYNHQALKLGKGQSEDDISKMPMEKQAAARKSEVERLATMAVLTQKDTGDTVLSALQGALDRGDTAFAAKIVQDNGISMTGDQYERAQKILKPNVDYQKGNDALAAFNSKTLTEAEIKNSSSKEVFATFKQLQSIDETNKKEADVEQVGTFMAAFYENKADGLGYAAKNIYSNPKFLALSGVSQAAIRSRIDNEIGPDSAATQTKLMNSGMGRYLELSDDPELAAMSPGKLNFERQNIGNTLVNQLLIQQKAIKTGAAQDKIDPALIKDAMTKEIAGDKNRSAAFNGYIAYKYNKWKTDNPNQKLDLEEKRLLIASAYNESIVPGGGFFGGDKVTPAYQDTKGAIPDAIFKTMTGTDKSKIEFYSKTKGLGMSESDIVKAIAWENNRKNASSAKSASTTKVQAQPKSFAETPREQSDLVKSIPK